MIKKTILILVLFFTSLPVFLLATLPASVAWEKVISPLTKTTSVGVKAKSFSGTAWNGAAHITFRHLEGVVSWDVQLLNLFGGSLPLSLDLQSSAGEFDMLLDVGLRAQSILLKDLRLDLEQLNPFLRAQRVKVSGELIAKNVAVSVDKQFFTAIDGRFSWGGGAVSYPAGRDIHDRVMPGFSGKVSTSESQTISLGIRDQEASFDSMRGSWSEGGDALWEVTRRVLDVANEPWAQNSAETDVIFKVKKGLPRSLGK